MIDFNDDYLQACFTPSDINEHLPVMSALARDCQHVTEFGVRWGTSSICWLANDVILRSYDIESTPEAEAIFARATAADKDARFIIQDTLTITDLEYTDLLFFDSKHSYDQVKAELGYAPKVRKYMVFHDTVLFGQVGEDGTTGIWPAIEEFLAGNSSWKIKTHRTNNNGLTVLERTAA
jgi:cephalosporin hydroxylase